MLKVASLVSISVWVCNAATLVTVLELGKGGSVRRTTKEASALSSVDGVTGLWSEVHGIEDKQRRNLASSASMVADIFHKADAGIVINLGTVSAKEVAKKVGKSVGALEVAGKQGKHLLYKASSEVKKIADSAEVKDIAAVADKVQAIDVSSLKEVSREVASLLKKLQQEADEQQNTVVVHLISEDSSAVSRRLEEADDDDDANQNNQNSNGYYGYYNDYGEWVTNYRTIYQIQYYNVVLWTTVGLVVLAYATNVMLVSMPLMEDTLLFGETAKMSNQ